jgi:hypothetical protein
MAAIAASHEPDPSPPADDSALEPRRLRLVALRAQRFPSGQCRAEVELQRQDGEIVLGVRDGPAIALGDLRIVAEATIEALHRATRSELRFELLGVKTVRAFDETVVLAHIGVVAGRAPVRLVGAAMGNTDLTRATVLSVLNATNRILGNASD